MKNKIIFFSIILSTILLFSLFLSKDNFPGNFEIIGTAHASDIHEDLTPPGTATSSAWVFTIWRVSLGLADVFVALVLLFLAIAQITRIQYDTYQIKKSLPLLLGGIITSHFSLLICRMIVDAAQVLTITFAGNPQDLVEGYLCAVALTQRSGFEAILTSGFSMLFIIVAFFVIMIAVFALSFLLWIRKFVILLLASIAPAAFILYAFSPTQTLFKQWWQQFLRWAFMGPVVMGVMYIASKIGEQNCTDFNISALFAVVGLTIIGFAVPFKLGGAVMNATGGWMGKAAKGGTTLAAKGSWNKANQAAEKKWNWSPRTKWDAYKMRKAEDEAKHKTLSTAKARGQQYYDAALDAYADEQAQSRYLKPMGGSRTTYQKAVKELLQTGDKETLQGILANAQKDGMFQDCLDLMSGEVDEHGNIKWADESVAKLLKEQYGMSDDDLLNVKTDNAIQSKLMRNLFCANAVGKTLKDINSDQSNQAGLRVVNKLQDNATSGGNYSAMDVFYDTDKGKFVAKDREDKDDYEQMSGIWKARFQSPEAGKTLSNFRKESFAGTTPEGKTVFTDLIEKGLLTSAHLENLKRTRASTIKYMQEHLDEIRAAGPNGTALINAMQHKGLLTAAQASPPTTLEMDDGAMLNIDKIPADKITPDVEQKILSKVAGYQGADVEKIHAVVNANQHLSPELKGKVELHLKMNQHEKMAVDMRDIDPHQAHLQSSEIMSDIKDNLRNYMEANMNFPEKIQRIKNKLPIAEKENFMKNLKTALETSHEPVMDMAGMQLSASDLVKAYNNAITDETSEKTPELKFLDQLQALHPQGKVSQADYDKAWQLAYGVYGEGSKRQKPPKKTKQENHQRGGRQSVKEEEEEEEDAAWEASQED